MPGHLALTSSGAIISVVPTQLRAIVPDKLLATPKSMSFTSHGGGNRWEPWSGIWPIQKLVKMVESCIDYSHLNVQPCTLFQWRSDTQYETKSAVIRFAAWGFLKHGELKESWSWRRWEFYRTKDQVHSDGSQKKMSGGHASFTRDPFRQLELFINPYSQVTGVVAVICWAQTSGRLVRCTATSSNRMFSYAMLSNIKDAIQISCSVYSILTELWLMANPS